MTLTTDEKKATDALTKGHKWVCGTCGHEGKKGGSCPQEGCQLPSGEGNALSVVVRRDRD